MIPNGITEVASAIAALPQDAGRVFVAIVGAPGAGKSTFAQALLDHIDGAAILPMDGFHLDNATLSDRGLLHRKGAPQTFDTQGLLRVLHQIRAGGAVRVPTFDRTADCVVPAGGRIEAETRVVLVEGNYLLLDASGWRDMHPFWDLSVFLDVPMPELESRLIQRWLDHGMPRDAAEHRARQNDIINAQTVHDSSIQADCRVRQL